MSIGFIILIVRGLFWLRHQYEIQRSVKSLIVDIVGGLDFYLIVTLYTAALQVCHPLVALGVHRHSRYQEDGLGRAVSTVRFLHRLLETRTDKERQDLMTGLAKRHSRIQGMVTEETVPNFDERKRFYNQGYTEYGFFEEQNLWVWAVTVHALLTHHRLIAAPLTDHEKSVIYRILVSWAMGMKIPSVSIPRTYGEFEIWFSKRLASFEYIQYAEREVRQVLNVKHRVFILFRGISKYLLPREARRIIQLESSVIEEWWISESSALLLLLIRFIRPWIPSFINRAQIIM